MGRIKSIGLTDSNALIIDDQNDFRCVSVVLTAAQIIAMNGTPVTIVPAPGSGKYITVDQINFQMKPGGTQFTGGGALTIEYHGTSTATHAGTLPASVVTSASASNTVLGPASASNGTTAPTNTGLDITNATAAFATGNGTAVISVYYLITTLQ